MKKSQHLTVQNTPSSSNQMNTSIDSPTIRSPRTGRKFSISGLLTNLRSNLVKLMNINGDVKSYLESEVSHINNTYNTEVKIEIQEETVNISNESGNQIRKRSSTKLSQDALETSSLDIQKSNYSSIQSQSNKTNNNSLLIPNGEITTTNGPFSRTGSFCLMNTDENSEIQELQVEMTALPTSVCPSGRPSFSNNLIENQSMEKSVDASGSGSKRKLNLLFSRDNSLDEGNSSSSDNEKFSLGQFEEPLSGDSIGIKINILTNKESSEKSVNSQDQQQIDKVLTSLNSLSISSADSDKQDDKNANSVNTTQLNEKMKDEEESKDEVKSNKRETKIELNEDDKKVITIPQNRIVNSCPEVKIEHAEQHDQQKLNQQQEEDCKSIEKTPGQRLDESESDQEKNAVKVITNTTPEKNVKIEKLEENLIKNEKSEIQIIPSEQNKPQLQTNHSNQTSSLEKLDIENPKEALTSLEKTSTSIRQDFENVNDEKSLKLQKAKDSEKIESSKMPISNSAPGLCTSFSPASIAKQLSLPSCPPSSLPRNETSQLKLRNMSLISETQTESEPENNQNTETEEDNVDDDESSDDYISGLKQMRTSKLRVMTGDDPLHHFDADVGQIPEPEFRFREIDLKMLKKGTLERFNYTCNRNKLLGGGKWGRVFECFNEKHIQLAAKSYQYSNKTKRKISGYTARMQSSAARKLAGKQELISEQEVYNEIKIMNQLNHQNLVRLFDAVEEEKKGMVLIMEYLNGGELLHRINQDDFEPSEIDIVEYMKQLCDACRYMHSENIIHLDLKPENIMCCDLWSNRIKIIDFGLARVYDPNKHIQVMLGTPEFTAPEVLSYEPVSFATDMWSLGVILYILFSGYSPFLGDTDDETIANIMETDPEYPDDLFGEVSDDGSDFLQGLIVDEPESRLTAKECCRHPWLTDNSVDRIQKLRIREKQRKSYQERPGGFY